MSNSHPDLNDKLLESYHDLQKRYDALLRDYKNRLASHDELERRLEKNKRAFDEFSKDIMIKYRKRLKRGTREMIIVIIISTFNLCCGIYFIITALESKKQMQKIESTHAKSNSDKNQN